MFKREHTRSIVDFEALFLSSKTVQIIHVQQKAVQSYNTCTSKCTSSLCFNCNNYNIAYEEYQKLTALYQKKLISQMMMMDICHVIPSLIIRWNRCYVFYIVNIVPFSSNQSINSDACPDRTEPLYCLWLQVLLQCSLVLSTLVQQNTFTKINF